MMHPTRLLLGTMLLAVAACATDAPAPTAAPTADMSSFDPALGAVAGQASLPGLTMSTASTFAGAPDGRAEDCVYSATTGRFSCPPVVRGGLTTTRSFAFLDAAGKPQARRDSSTRSSNTQVTVKGTVTSERGTSTVDRSSTLTVSGLGPAATRHTLNGTETGKTVSTFTGERGTMTATETFTATTSNVVVPVPRGKDVWPLSGTTTRSLSSTRSGPDGAARSSTGSEQVTYTGTSVVNVTVTRDGVARTCTRDLAKRSASTCR